VFRKFLPSAFRSCRMPRTLGERSWSLGRREYRTRKGNVAAAWLLLLLSGQQQKLPQHLGKSTQRASSSCSIIRGRRNKQKTVHRQSNVCRPASGATRFRKTPFESPTTSRTSTTHCVPVSQRTDWQLARPCLIGMYLACLHTLPLCRTNTNHFLLPPATATQTNPQKRPTGPKASKRWKQ
jgi:hypothetical protein